MKQPDSKALLMEARAKLLRLGDEIREALASVDHALAVSVGAVQPPRPLTEFRDVDGRVRKIRVVSKK